MWVTAGGGAVQRDHWRIRWTKKCPPILVGSTGTFYYDGTPKVKCHGLQSFSKIRVGFFTWEIAPVAFHRRKNVVYYSINFFMGEEGYA